MKTNTTKGDLWSQIIERKEMVFSENRFVWAPQTFEDYPGVEVEYVDKTWLTDVVGLKRISNLEDGDCLALIAQTGSGKTSLLSRLCIPMAKTRGRKILYLSSRIALCKKIKIDAMNDEVNGEIQIGKHKVKDLKRLLSEDGLNEQINFGLMDIITYQAFITMHESLNAEDYEFICLDECHAFLSDAPFNPFMEEILHILVQKFRFCKRIYTTATPQECIQMIFEAENLYHLNNYKMVGGRKFPIILMSHDYEYLKPKFFTKTSEISKEILSRPNELWLIFVRNKTVAEELKLTFLQKSLSPEIFTADSDKESNDTYKNIINKEKLTTNIFITTRVLDTGVNIKNKDVKFNIVIFEDDIIEIMQMIGRKRVEKSEEINIYFYAPNVSDLKSSINNINHKVNVAKKMLAGIDNNEYKEAIEPPVYIHGKNVYVNSLFFKKNNLDIERYMALIDDMSVYDSSFEQRKAYALWLLSNFENIEYDVDSLFLINSNKTVNKILQNCLGNTYSKENFKKIGNEIKEILGDNRVKESDSAPSIGKLNEMISKFGYVAESSGQPVTYTFRKKEESDVQ